MIYRRVVDRLLQRVNHLILISIAIAVIAVVLVLLSFCSSISRVDEQVKGIVVVREVCTVCIRHRAPSRQSTVVLGVVVIVATIPTSG